MRTYEQILRDLDIVERTSPVAQALAREMIELAHQGVRTRNQLTEIVMEELSSG
jgi:DNA-binding IclR family transcriptional regulator